MNSKSISIPDWRRSHSFYIQKGYFLRAVKHWRLITREWGGTWHIGARGCCWLFKDFPGDRQIWNSLQFVCWIPIPRQRNTTAQQVWNINTSSHSIFWGNVGSGRFVTYISLPSRHQVCRSDKHSPGSPSQRSNSGLLVLANGENTLKGN